MNENNTLTMNDLVETHTYKDHVIKIFELKADKAFLEYEKTDDISILEGNEFGHFGYRVYTQDNINIYEDLYDMGDEGACLMNAESEIDSLIEDQKMEEQA